MFGYRKIYIVRIPNYTMENKMICPKCKSNSTIKWCRRKTQNRGLIQRYKSKDCLNTFVLNKFIEENEKCPSKDNLCY